jgi:hypothetical protein
MRAAMRLPPLLASVTLLLAAPGSRIAPREMLGEAPRMAAARVSLDPRDPARTRVGALTYLGGVRLTSPDRAFGSFSAMRVAGDRFTLVSDSGNLVHFRMGADWQPRDVTFGDLPGGPDNGAAKYQRDAESLTWDPETGRTWVAFENRNQIWRFDGALTRPERSAAPAAMAGWSPAGGAETMVRLRNGQFVLIAEMTRPKGGVGRIGLRFARDPTEAQAPPLRFVYVPPPGYDPSDAVELPDGRLLVLNRRLALRGLFTAKLTVADLRGLTADAVVRGPVIATLAAPVLHDNYEALAITREGADTILWIASDDNGQFWEQSLLLKFRIEFAR